MMQPFISIAPMLLAACLLSGCGTTGGTYKVSKAAPPAVVTVAVRQFTSPGYASLPAADKGLRDFEHIFLPGKLVGRLAVTPGISGAYFTSGPTASVDFVVDGQVLKSNGKDLNLRIIATRVDGAKVLDKSYQFAHRDGREAIVKAQLVGYLDRVVGDILATARKTNINLAEARAKAYAENGALVVSPQVISDASEAGLIERDDILAPLTKALVPRARIAEASYIEWQGLSTPLVLEQEAAGAQKSAAEFGQALRAC